MALRIKIFVIIKVVAKNDTLMCMQSSLHLSYASYLLTAVLWDKLDLNCIFCKEGQLFKFIGKFRYLGLQKLPEDFLIENATRNVIFFFFKQDKRNCSWGILDIYFRNCKQKLCSASLDWRSTYWQQLYFRLNFRKRFIRLFVSPSEDENDILLSTVTLVFLNFDALYSLEN